MTLIGSCLVNAETTQFSHISHSGHLNFPLQVYKLYKLDRTLEVVDAALASTVVPAHAELCIKIGLLCTQSDPHLRPTMRRVVVVLSQKPVTLEEPTKPGYVGATYRRNRRHNASSSTARASSSSQSFGSVTNSNTASLSATATTSGTATATVTEAARRSALTNSSRLADPRGKRPVED